MGKKVMIVLGKMIVILSSVALIPIDLYWIDIPKWISVLTMIIIGAILLWKWLSRVSVVKKLASTLACMIIVGFIFLGTFCNPYRCSNTRKQNVDYAGKDYQEILTYREAKQDLDEAMKHLSDVHPLCLHGLTDKMEIRYQQAESNLKDMDEITVNDLYRELQKIMASIGDGHTQICGRYPDPHYLKEIYRHNMAGDSLVGINGKKKEEFFEEVKDLYCYECEEYGIADMLQDTSSKESLAFLGIDVADGVTFTYEDAEGNLTDETFYEDDFVTYEEYLKYNNLETDTGDTAENASECYEICQERNLAILTLYSCDYDDGYCRCLKEMFTQIKEQGIENVCVDLRDNGGGSSLVVNEFIQYLNVDSYKNMSMRWRLGFLYPYFEGGMEKNVQKKGLIFDGKVYVITNVRTFSSAMDFAMMIQDNQLGIVVGEASGNTPEGYGDVVDYKLKHSGLYMQVSMKKWYRVDRENPAHFIEPDLECTPSEALERVYECIEKGEA